MRYNIISTIFLLTFIVFGQPCFAAEQQIAAKQPPTEDAAATIRELEEKLAEAKQDIAELQRTLRAAANAKRAFEELGLGSTNAPANDSGQMDILRASSLSNVFRDASKKVIPATVKVLANSRRPSIGVDGGVIARKALRSMTPSNESMVGSGVIIDPKGIVLTSHHVVANSRYVDVELPDGRVFQAINLKEDERTDIALLWLNSDDPIPYAKFGDSDVLDIGDWVLAIGNPFDLDSTVSAGIISAKGRTLKKIERGEFLQTDAAINPGNSGGPLINLRGEIIGLNTAIASKSGANQGIGFAIPSNSVKWVTNQLITNGRVIRAYLGIETIPITGDLAQLLGVEPRQGVVVSRVHEETPAEKGGVKRDDVIYAFDGQPVTTQEELDRIVEQADVEQPHVLSVVRSKQKGEIKLRIEEMPAGFSTSRSLIGNKAKSHTDQQVGILLLDLTAEMASRYNIDAKTGVIIVSVTPGSVGARCGLKPGMLIEKIDTLPIETTKDYIAARKRAPIADGFDYEIVTPEGKQKIKVIRR